MSIGYDQIFNFYLNPSLLLQLKLMHNQLNPTVQESTQLEVQQTNLLELNSIPSDGNYDSNGDDPDLKQNQKSSKDCQLITNTAITEETMQKGEPTEVENPIQLALPSDNTNSQFEHLKEDNLLDEISEVQSKELQCQALKIYLKPNKTEKFMTESASGKSKDEHRGLQYEQRPFGHTKQAPNTPSATHKDKRQQFFIACQRKHKQADLIKKKRQRQAVNTRAEQLIQKEKLKTEVNPQFQKYFQKCKFQLCGRRCPEGHTIEMVCVERNCNFQSYHCRNLACSTCVQRHRTCNLKFTLEMFSKNLEKNVDRQRKIMQVVYESYDRILKRVEENRKKSMTFLCVQGIDSNLFKQLEDRYRSSQYLSFKGREVLDLLEMINTEGDRNHERERKIAEKMKEDETLFMQKFQQEMRLLLEPYSLCDVSILKSNLLTIKSDVKFVLEHLNFPCAANLLYRASDNQFNISKFHELCDDESSTLTIVKTQFGKLIAGFTPLKWKNNTHGRDRSNNSFLMAVNLKQKLEHIKHGQSAIYYDSSLGPSFGGLFEGKDLQIFVENGLLQCKTSFPNAYNWKRFFASGQESWRFLTGVQDGKKCRVMDYEVFKVVSRQ